MKITEVEINKIKPDPKQPRTSIDDIDIHGLAQSIITEGVINPIEVDEHFVIITGERRWRAAKMAGLKTVPVKVVHYEGDARFMRQVIENIHHNTMDEWDTANALKRCLEMWPGKKKERDRSARTGADYGIEWLAKKTGKSINFIETKLDLLDQSQEFQKAVKEKKIVPAFVSPLTSAKAEHKSIVEKKILSGEFSTRNAARDFVAALNRETKNPDKIKRLLSIDYSKYKGVNEVERVIHSISPRLADRVAKSYEPSQEVSKIAEELKNWLANNPKRTIGAIHAPRVVTNLNFIRNMVGEWFKEQELLN